MDIKLNITLQDATVILKALAQGPYEQVASLIDVIQGQCTTQVKAAQAAEPDTEAMNDISE